MIAIICQKGTIDANRCVLHIVERGISEGPDQPPVNEGYDLALTHLDTNVETVISNFPVKHKAKFAYRRIKDAIRNGYPSVDIRDLERAKFETGDS